MASDNSLTADEAAELAQAAAVLDQRRTELPRDNATCRPVGDSLDVSAMLAQGAANRARHEELERRKSERDEAAKRDAALRHWNNLGERIGKRYRGASFDNYERYDNEQRRVVADVQSYADSLPEHFNAGQGLILYGPVGTGKDHLMTAVLRVAALEHGFHVEHVYGLELHAMMRESIDAERVEKPLQRYMDAQVLAISDPLPNDGQLTPFQRQTMMRLVNTRYVRMLPTVLTINAPSVEQGTAEGDVVWNDMTDPVFDRLMHGAVVVKCWWPSYRQRGSE